MRAVKNSMAVAGGHMSSDGRFPVSLWPTADDTSDAWRPNVRHESIWITIPSGR